MMRSPLFGSAVTLIAAAIFASAAQAQLIVQNGDFSSGNGYGPPPSAGVDGTNVPDFNYFDNGNAGYYGSFGTDVFINDNGSTDTGEFISDPVLDASTSTAAKFTLGTTYTVSVQIAHPPLDQGFNTPGNVVLDLVAFTSATAPTSPTDFVQIGTGDMILASSITSTAFTTFSYTLPTAVTDALAGDYFGVEIQANANGGSNQTIFDNVAVTVPEPGTWAMLLGGVGLLAVLSRFRQRLIA